MTDVSEKITLPHISYTAKMFCSYPEIGGANFKWVLWTISTAINFEKCECVEEFLLFYYHHLCTVAFRTYAIRGGSRIFVGGGAKIQMKSRKNGAVDGACRGRRP